MGRYRKFEGYAGLRQGEKSSSAGGVGQKSSCCFREVIKAAVKSTRWSRKDGVPELNESVTFQLLLYLDSVHMSINSNTVIES